MSEIRFGTQALYPTFTTAGTTGAGHGAATVESNESNVSSSPFLTTGTTSQMFGPLAYNRGSNPQNASSLVQMQSDTASSITHPSGGDDDFDFRLHGEQASRGAKTVTSFGTAFARAGSNFGRLAQGGAPFIGLVGTAFILPESFRKAGSNISTAAQSGDLEDINRAGGATASAVGNTAKGVKAGLDSYNLVNRSQRFARFQATRSAASAFRQSAPNASRTVVNAASRQAARDAMQNTLQRTAAYNATNAARTASRGAGSVARGAGTATRQGARLALRQGGQAAARAATTSVARSAMATGAKAGARFIPGLNVGIAALDTAVAASTLADRNASVGKKVTSVITAAGSIAAATNIPVVSQVGAVVSAVSSFAGAFF